MLSIGLLEIGVKNVRFSFGANDTETYPRSQAPLRKGEVIGAIAYDSPDRMRIFYLSGRDESPCVSPTVYRWRGC